MAPSATSMSSHASANEGARRFACTSCGKCCNSGPEMELSEATALADKFITSLCLSVWRLPLGKDDALEEHRRQIGHFSVRDTIDRARAQSLHLTISARTIDRERGRCPALVDKSCGVYEARPLSCRAVPLHYSQPESQLALALDAFVRLPGHLCDASAEAPIVFDGERVTDPSMRQAREDALALAKANRAWKKEILSLMDDPEAARAAGLPTYDAVVRRSESGARATVSMLVAWRIARNAGILSPQAFDAVCAKQIALIKTELACAADLQLATHLVAMLPEYEAASAQARP